MRATAVIFLVLLFIGTSFAVQPAPYQTGELVDFRVFEGAGSGNPCTVLAITVRELLVHAAHCPTFAWNAFNPAEFTVGGDVQVRFEGSNIVLQRPNGKEIKARITRRMRVVKQATLVSSAGSRAVDGEQAPE
ncbi:MAG: hypothetical protein ACE14L_11250 [Terriglobales bacterium]